MMDSILEHHRFQFTSFSSLWHEAWIGKGNLTEDHSLLYFTRACGKVTIGGDVYPIRSGSVIALPPYTDISIEMTTGWQAAGIQYRLWLSNNEPVEQRWMLPLVFSPDDFNHTKTRLYKMVHLSGHKVSERVLRCPIAVCAPVAHELVVEHWSRETLQPIRSGIVDHRIEKLHDILMSPGYDRYDAKELATESGLSLSHMNRLFKKVFRCAPQKKWEDRRLSEICIAFRSRPDVTVREIAFEFGFDDPSYFSQWFKRRIGCSPVAYRKGIMDSDMLG